MNTSSSLAGCKSPFCRDSFYGLRLRKASIPSSLSTHCKVRRHGHPQHFQGHKDAVGYFVQASIRGVRYQHHEGRAVELHWGQMGANRCVKNRNTRKFRHVSRVGSFLRNLEQEDETERDGKYSRIHNADTNTNPLPCLDLEESDGERSKNVADGKNGGVASQDTPIFYHADRSLGSLLGDGDLGWRDAVVQGFGQSNGALQLRPGVEKDDGRPSEDVSSGKKELDKKDDGDDDDSANITRIPVPRQTFIAVPKVELVSSLVALHPSSEDASMLLEVFACLESVIHAEHKSLLEELRMDYRLAHSTDEDDKPSVSKQDESKFRSSLKWRPKEWWNRLSEKVTDSLKKKKKKKKKKSKADDSRDDVHEDDGPLPGVMDMLTEEVFETQREKATVRFQQHFMRLLRSAQFKGLSVNDLKLTAALNSDYLLTLPIDVDWNSAASADALLFRRGYATERQEGLLFGAKLDYIQSIFLSNISNSLTEYPEEETQHTTGFLPPDPMVGRPPQVKTPQVHGRRTLFRLHGPLFRAGRWCIKKWESLEEDEEGRALTERIERWLEEPLQRANNLNDDSDDESSESDIEEGQEIWKAARKAVPRYEAVLSSAGSRGILLRRVLVRMGILSPASPRLPDLQSQLVDHPAAEPYMRPKMLARVSMRDIWKPASKAACGNNPWKQIRASFSVFFSRSTLQEPAYQELVLLYNQPKSEQGNDEVPGLQLHTYTKIPVPDLKVVFPNKKLSFRLIDTVRLDLATLAGLVAFLVSNKFDDLLSSPSAFVLDVIASVSLIIYVTRVTLGYKQTANRYELLVNKTLYEKTLASGFGVVHFLLDASEDQLFKGAVLVYTLMLLEGQSLPIQKIATLCERFLYNNFKEQVEMPMKEIMGILLRLGLVVEDSTEAGSYISALPDGKAIAALKQKWLALMSTQSIWSVR